MKKQKVDLWKGFIFNIFTSEYWGRLSFSQRMLGNTLVNTMLISISMFMVITYLLVFKYQSDNSNIALIIDRLTKWRFSGLDSTLFLLLQFCCLKITAPFFEHSAVFQDRTAFLCKTTSSCMCLLIKHTLRMYTGGFFFFWFSTGVTLSDRRLWVRPEVLNTSVQTEEAELIASVTL